MTLVSSIIKQFIEGIDKALVGKITDPATEIDK